MNVAIYCGSANVEDKIYEIKAKELIQRLVSENYNIVYGGSKQGLMGVISNEALKCEAKVYGVITYDLASKELENKNITKIYKVDTINQRKEKMVELSDVFIALAGGYGTFDELLDVISSIQIGYLKKPCVLFNTNGYYDKLIEFFYDCSKIGYIKKDFVDMLIVSDDIEDILAKLKDYKAPKSKWEN